MGITLFDYPRRSHSALVVLRGETTEALEGELTVAHKGGEQHPPLRLQVQKGLFHAPVHLHPGDNELVLTNSDASLSITVHYEPLHTPPLRMVLVLFADSPETFPLPLAKEHEPNGQEAALAKLKLMGRIMETSVGFAMRDMGFGYRTFHFEEEEVYDEGSNVKNDYPRVHIVRSQARLADIRSADTEVESNNLQESITNALFPDDTPQGRHVVLYMDREAPLGLNTDKALSRSFKGESGYSLNMISSHVLHSWPSSVGMISQAFTDDRFFEGTEFLSLAWGNISNHVLNKSVEALVDNMAMALSHLTSINPPYKFAPPAGYFTVGSVMAKSTVSIACMLQMLYHPCLSLPSDPICPSTSPGLVVTPVSENETFINSVAGFFSILLHSDNKIRGILHFLPESLGGQGPQHEMVLTRDQLLAAMKRVSHGFCVYVSLFTFDQQRHDCTLDELFVNDITGDFGLGRGLISVSKSPYWGIAASRGEKHSFYFDLSKVVGVFVYSRHALDGIEFQMADSSTVLIGNRGDQRSPMFQISGHETISHFNVRSGVWMDAIQIVTTTGRQSPWFGGQGGNVHKLSAPQGFEMCGMFGTVNRTILYSLGVIYTEKQ